MASHMIRPHRVHIALSALRKTLLRTATEMKRKALRKKLFPLMVRISTPSCVCPCMRTLSIAVRTLFPLPRSRKRKTNKKSTLLSSTSSFSLGYFHPFHPWGMRVRKRKETYPQEENMVSFSLVAHCSPLLLRHQTAICPITPFSVLGCGMSPQKTKTRAAETFLFFCLCWESKGKDEDESWKAI